MNSLFFEWPEPVDFGRSRVTQAAIHGVTNYKFVKGGVEATTESGKLIAPADFTSFRIVPYNAA